jgi:hypothetical protein
VLVFEQGVSLEDAIGSHYCWFDVSIHVTQLTIVAGNSVQTLKVLVVTEAEVEAGPATFPMKWTTVNWTKAPTFGSLTPPDAEQPTFIAPIAIGYGHAHWLSTAISLA